MKVHCKLCGADHASRTQYKRTKCFDGTCADKKPGRFAYVTYQAVTEAVEAIGSNHYIKTAKAMQIHVM